MKRQNMVFAFFFIFLMFLGINSCSFLAIEMLADNMDGAEDENGNSADNNVPNENNDVENNQIEYEVITIADETFTLAWDTDDNTFTTYRVFYKILNTSETQLIEEVNLTEDSELSVQLTSDQFTKDDYIVLGVAAVDSQGEMSDIHFSTDITAVPSQGWVLKIS